MIEIKAFVNKPIDENCYVVSDTISREAMIIDCGALLPDDQQSIASYIADNGLSVKHHVLTHGHFDHLFGASWVAQTYDCNPMVHADDADFYNLAPQMCATFFHRPVAFTLPPIGSLLAESDTLQLGATTFTLIHTPGHTPGGCCIYCESEGLLFTGDSLFRESIGRTDLPGGNHAALVKALSKKIMTLPESVKAYPGHGPATTIAHEKKHNLYL